MNTIEYKNTTFVIKEGLSQAIINSFLKGGDVVVKKHCAKCGFVLGQYTGRYPINCPVCGNPFEREDITASESYGAYVDGKCVGILERKLDEGSFKNIDNDLNELADWTLELVNSKDIKNKKDLSKHITSMKNHTYIPKGMDAAVIRDHFSELVKRISKKLKDANVKL